MKSIFALAGAVLLVGLAGCASEPQKEASAGNDAVATKEARCLVTGSNLPKRDCLNDVKVLPASAVEGVLPTLRGAGQQ
ncbi:MAG: hypothetical protein ABIZ83_15360 [Casimicrobium sp.]